MNLPELIKAVFNRKFLKYFLITFAVVVFVSGIGFYEHYLDRFIESRTTLWTSFYFWLILAASMLPNTIAISFCFAAFLSFRKIPEQATVKDFIKILGVGTAFTLIIAAGIFSYDRNVTPGLKAQLSEKMYGIFWRGYPDEIDSDWNFQVDFKDLTPSAMNQKKLSSRADSLSLHYNNLGEECIELLSQLPDSIAKKAYSSYQLRNARLPYVYAEGPSDSEKEEVYAQIASHLYGKAVDLHETRTELLRYRKESAARWINSVGLLVGFLLWASAGFAIRKKNIRTVLGVIAALVLLVYFITFISKQTSNFVDRQVKITREYDHNTRR